MNLVTMSISGSSLQFQSGGGNSILLYFLYGKHSSVRDDQPTRFDKTKLSTIGKWLPECSWGWGHPTSHSTIVWVFIRVQLPSTPWTWSTDGLSTVPRVPGPCSWALWSNFCWRVQGEKMFRMCMQQPEAWDQVANFWIGRKFSKCKFKWLFQGLPERDFWILWAHSNLVRSMNCLFLIRLSCPVISFCS